MLPSRTTAPCYAPHPFAFAPRAYGRKTCCRPDGSKRLARHASNAASPFSRPHVYGQQHVVVPHGSMRPRLARVAHTPRCCWPPHASRRALAPARPTPFCRTWMPVVPLTHQYNEPNANASANFFTFKQRGREAERGEANQRTVEVRVVAKVMHRLVST